MPRPPRPKKEKVSVWLTEDERKLLYTRSEGAGFKAYADLVRHVAAGGGISSAEGFNPRIVGPDQDEFQAARELVSRVRQTVGTDISPDLLDSLRHVVGACVLEAALKKTPTHTQPTT